MQQILIGWLQRTVWTDLVSCVTNVAQTNKLILFHNYIITGIRVVYFFSGRKQVKHSHLLWQNIQMHLCDLSNCKTFALKSGPPCFPSSPESIIWGQRNSAAVYLGDEWKVCGEPQRADYNLGQGDNGQWSDQTSANRNLGPNFPFKLGGCECHSS